MKLLRRERAVLDRALHRAADLAVGGIVLEADHLRPQGHVEQHLEQGRPVLTAVRPVEPGSDEFNIFSALVEPHDDRQARPAGFIAKLLRREAGHEPVELTAIFQPFRDKKFFELVECHRHDLKVRAGNRSHNGDSLPILRPDRPGDSKTGGKNGRPGGCSRCVNHFFRGGVEREEPSPLGKPTGAITMPTIPRG